MWCRNFPLRAFSDTRTEIISNRENLNSIIKFCGAFLRLQIVDWLNKKILIFLATYFKTLFVIYCNKNALKSPGKISGAFLNFLIDILMKETEILNNFGYKTFTVY
jgi:hypothetical protein